MPSHLLSPRTLGELARAAAARLPEGADASMMICRAAPLDRAGSADVAVYDGSVDMDHLVATRAGACFVSPHVAAYVPSTTVALITDCPGQSFRSAVSLFGDPLLPQRASVQADGDASALVHADALVERDVVIEPGAVIGSGAEIGTGSFVAAHAVIAAGVCIGRGCAIHAGATVAHALIGDRVIVHAGASVGSPRVTVAGKSGRAPQLGRVIVQDDVEIGAGSVVQRGSSGDTVIGEGSAIEPLALVPGDQIVGRHTIVRGR